MATDRILKKQLAAAITGLDGNGYFAGGVWQELLGGKKYGGKQAALRLRGSVGTTVHYTVKGDEYVYLTHQQVTMARNKYDGRVRLVSAPPASSRIPVDDYVLFSADATVLGP